MNELYEDLLNKAKEMSTKSYSPYSKFPVGAAVLYESGKIYTGCNVENASFGLSLCAERCAMAKAISDNEKTKIKAIAIYSPSQTMCSPCGACRQWLQEFSSDNEKTLIILEGDDKKPCILSLKEIFPYSFKFNTING